MILPRFAGPLAGRLGTGHWMARAAGDDAPLDSSHYERRSRAYAALGATEEIVFLGDSRIEWGQWSEILGRRDISNRGISGDTTSGILHRLLTSVPRAGIKCILQMGVNDLSKGVRPSEVLTNYGSILRALRDERQADMIATSIILVGQDRAELNRAIVECNRGLPQLAASVGASWLDLNTTLSPHGFLAAEFSDDGVHLNRKGYEEMCRALVPLLPPISKE